MSEKRTAGEALDARISRLEELLRVNLETTIETPEKIHRRLRDDPRIAAAIEEIVGITEPWSDDEAAR